MQLCGWLAFSFLIFFGYFLLLPFFFGVAFGRIFAPRSAYF